MGLGTAIRLGRVFNHPSGRLFGVAVDHFASYGTFTPDSGLYDLPGALARLMEAGPDSVTINVGAAKNYWARYAGRSALIVETGMFTPDDRIGEVWTDPLDAVRLGADAIAVAIGVRGPQEGRSIRALAETVRKAERYELPVFAHIYPRSYETGVPVIEFTPEQIAWAARVGIETGADVIKVGYPGDRAAFAEIVSWSTVPVVAAGGPHADSLEAALQQIRESIDAGAVGAVVGRNIWDDKDPVLAALAYKAVIHDGAGAAEAIAAARAVRDHDAG